MDVPLVHALATVLLEQFYFEARMNRSFVHNCNYFWRDSEAGFTQLLVLSQHSAAYFRAIMWAVGHQITSQN